MTENKEVQSTALKNILEGLMRRYSQRVPDVSTIISAMTKAGIIQKAEDIENDHIAFRTLSVPNLGIASFEKIFLNVGYQKRDYYHFEQKKLNAYWYSPPINTEKGLDNLPRIFISELIVDDLSLEAQRIIKKYTQSVAKDPVDDLDLNNGMAVDEFLHSPLWATPTIEDYKTLLAESEYAAWVIYNRYYLNHFTISVHNLPKGYNTIQEFNAFLENIGIKLNNSGGVIKQSPDGGLLQSSTVAQMVEAEFAGGIKEKIAGSYVEFAERKVLQAYSHLPENEILRKHRRDGFEAGNADKIFESTFSSQTGR
ncbi:MAG: DUF1338 domain-containing protein [Cyclobacteriaceae bacterium]